MYIGNAETAKDKNIDRTEFGTYDKKKVYTCNY